MIRRISTLVGVLFASAICVPWLADALSAGDAKAKQDAADRMRAMNQLKQIGLAMHGYHDRQGTFPPAALANKKGEALLSWRVLLLPYVDEQKLFREFNLEEPWDSPNNKKLLARRPKVFEPVRKDPGGGATFYQVFHGKGAGFEGNRGLGVREFRDGTSNTILVVEAADAVPWTKPADVPFDPKKPLPKLGAMFDDVFLTAFADGSVRSVRKTIAEKVLRAVITRAGGEVAQLD